MDEIKQWLEGPGDYDTGVMLYCRHGRNRNMKAYLQRKNDPNKLRYELGKLVGVDAFAIPKVKTQAPPLTTVKDKDELKPHERLKIIREGGVSFLELPEPLQQVYLEACDSYKQMRHFHEKMKLVATDAERAENRAGLLAQTERNRTCWAALDRWVADGTLPEPPIPEPKVGEESPGPVDAKSLNAARVGITRYLNLLDKTTDEQKRENYIAKLREFVSVVTAAGCDFGKNAPRLQALGLIA